MLNVIESKQVCNDLCRLSSSQLLFCIIEPSRDHIRMDIFSSTSADDVIDTIFNDEKFASIENHADVRV